MGKITAEHVSLGAFALRACGLDSGRYVSNVGIGPREDLYLAR
ncbi:hypothetical protein DSL72_003422 [Monilinia vaccinii-corymbosi]|uniref:Uncharacterized protein n=1 Tax=Monilinia vaccinii-corymbosi TaxID=61207 RepID=A0A8A3P163_9HELO|nr:hypothetical protein DSL72_003422 [Monilinia vaccinii-corymbosi]